MIEIIDLQSSVRAAPPWAGRRNTFKNDDRKSVSGLHYRGWTLVDCGGWRWAAKDGTNIRLRVCREHESQSESLSLFHDRVDKEED